MPLHTGTLYRFIPATQVGSVSEPEWVRQHCILDSNANLRFYADKQRTGGSTMKKMDMTRHYADVELEPQCGRDHVFVIRPFATPSATSPSTRGHREDSRSFSSQLHPAGCGVTQPLSWTTGSPPLRPTSPAILPIVAVSLKQAGDDDASSRQYRSSSSASDGIVLAAKNAADKRAWISVFRDIQQDIGKDDGDSDTDSVRSANPMYVLVGDPPTTTKYDDSGDERDDEDDDSDLDRLVTPLHRDDDAQRKRRRKKGAFSSVNAVNPDRAPFSSRSVPLRTSRSQRSSPRNRTMQTKSDVSRGKTPVSNGLSTARQNHHATSRAPVTRHSSGTSITRPKSSSISQRLRRGFSRDRDADNGLSAPLRVPIDGETSKTNTSARKLPLDPFAALTATASIAQTIDTSAKQRRSSRSCPATPLSFEENGFKKSKQTQRSNSSLEISTNSPRVVGEGEDEVRKPTKSSSPVEYQRSPSNPGTPRSSRLIKQRSQHDGSPRRERSGTHVSARRSSFRRGPRRTKSKSVVATRSTSSSNLALSTVATRPRQSSREQLKRVKRSATTPTSDVELDSEDENTGSAGDSTEVLRPPTDLHLLLFGSKYDLLAKVQDGGTTAQSDVPIMDDVPADLEIPREQIEKFLSWSTEQTKGKSSRHVKKAVSKKKRRFVADGFDLDLTYITDRIVAMGFPSENLEAVYRNDMKETQLFFNTRHRDHYMIYNLCSERDYDHGKFDNNVVSFPFDDHNCPPFDDMEPFCDKMDEWLCANEQNVAALHCKAGKGRTGLMICVYLIHTGMWKTSAQSLNFYGIARTYNQKGVTIPSQRRWVWYFEKYCQMRDAGVPRLLSRPLIITKIFVSETAPVFHSFNVKNKVLDKKYSSKRLRHKKSGNDQSCVLNCGSSMVVHKDVRVEFVKFSFGGGVKNRVFSFWFHTDFIENHRLRLEKTDIDKVNKDKKVQDFWVEVFFEDYQPAETEELKTLTNFRDRNPSDLSDSSTMGDDELIALGKQMKRSLPVRNRSWKLKIFRETFAGREAVQWLLEHAVATRDDAVIVGQQLLELGVFHFVRSEKTSVDEFQNSSQFYRFGRNKERQRADTADLITNDNNNVPSQPSLARATSTPLTNVRSPSSTHSNKSPRDRRASSIQRSAVTESANTASSSSRDHPILNENTTTTDVSVVTSSHDGDKDMDASASANANAKTTNKRNSSTPRNRGRSSKSNHSGAERPLLGTGATDADFSEIGRRDGGGRNGVLPTIPASPSLSPATDSEDEREYRQPLQTRKKR